MAHQRVQVTLRRAVVATVAASSLVLATLHASPPPSPHTPAEFNWDSITPSRDLQFTDCYDEFRCARLFVPVDWLEEDEARRDSKTMALAIIKLEANITDTSTTSSTSSSHGGTVIINPGGPGDSGVRHILTNGHFLRNMVDSDGKRFEVMSFDPRGMAFSTPSADCFTSEAARSLFNAQTMGTSLGGPRDLSDAAIARERAHAQALGFQCTLPGPDGYVVQEYVSTASVARDMLYMVDKIHELEVREQRSMREGRQHINGQGTAQAPLQDVTITSPSDDTDDREGNLSRLPRLQYYGTSYGTYLGNTFISMFPGRVKRMILDGNVVPEDYTTGDWTGNLVDTNKTFDYFFQSCFDVGSRCALFDSSDKSWKDVKAKVVGLTSRLNANPILITGDASKAPSILPGTSVLAALYDPIYSPIDRHADVAETLAQAINGNYTSLIATLGLGAESPDLCSELRDPAAYQWMSLAGLAVRCGDGDDLRNVSFDWWRDYYHRTISNSPDLGPDWADMGCIGWQARPKFRFTGPFGSPEANASDTPGRPLAPVLFLSSRYDPVTPLVSTYVASKAHTGSGILVQTSVGHCTILASPSECTRRHVSTYMDTGALPPQGAECPGDCVPFEECHHLRAQLPR